MWLFAALLLVNTLVSVQGLSNLLDAGRVVRPKGLQQNAPSSIRDELAALVLPKRDVRVWLPPDYDVNTATRHPVLYCHDGQHVIAEDFVANRKPKDAKRFTIISFYV
jgi:hypothetical protein